VKAPVAQKLRSATGAKGDRLRCKRATPRLRTLHYIVAAAKLAARLGRRQDDRAHRAGERHGVAQPPSAGPLVTTTVTGRPELAGRSGEGEWRIACGMTENRSERDRLCGHYVRRCRYTPGHRFKSVPPGAPLASINVGVERDDGLRQRLERCPRAPPTVPTVLRAPKVIKCPLCNFPKRDQGRQSDAAPAVQEDPHPRPPLGPGLINLTCA